MYSMFGYIRLRCEDAGRGRYQIRLAMQQRQMKSMSSLFVESDSLPQTTSSFANILVI